MTAPARSRYRVDVPRRAQDGGNLGRSHEECTRRCVRFEGPGAVELSSRPVSRPQQRQIGPLGPDNRTAASHFGDAVHEQSFLHGGAKAPCRQLRWRLVCALGLTVDEVQSATVGGRRSVLGELRCHKPLLVLPGRPSDFLRLHRCDRRSPNGRCWNCKINGGVVDSR